MKDYMVRGMEISEDKRRKKISNSEREKQDRGEK